MNPIVIIPARAGSKGLKNKNSKELAGKPMILYTIEAARTLFNDDVICVSTDSEAIIDLCNSIGLKVHFVRPDYLATDEASSVDVINHAISFYEEHFNYHADTIILLQPTSPLRNANHIREALILYNDVDMVVSVKNTKSNPYFNLFEEKEGYLIKSKKASFTRRQDCPNIYEYNGAIYIFNLKSFKDINSLNFNKIIKYIMDETSSIDIDNEIDFKIIEHIIKNDL
jgi:CMP-N,N'-diacetyllegionaminic acid synthase